MDIKDIYLELPNYSFDTNQEDYSTIIGRTEVQQKLRRRLAPSKKDCDYKGAYLVAGYRGMGKSTLVKKTIDSFNQRNESIPKAKHKILLQKIGLFKQKKIERTEDSVKLLNIEVFLSQGSLNDFDLLRQMFIQLKNKFEEKKIIKKSKKIKTYLAICFSFLVLLISSYFIHYFILMNYMYESIVLFLNEIYQISLLTIAIYVLIFFLIWFCSQVIFNYQKTERQSLEDKINYVNKRVHSSLEIFESTGDSALGLENISNDFKLPYSIVSASTDNSFNKQNFQKFTSKELEFEIKEILRLYSVLKSKNKKYIVFVIDELDKLEPELTSNEDNYLELGKSRAESRKETITSLLANLKSFVHTAKAKFVFIGGAEMYEASLADIADRESFYSSIFDEVFYVNTFFKDSLPFGKNSITQMVDKYLMNILIGSKNSELLNSNSDLYPQYSSFWQMLPGDSTPENRDLILYQINRFLIYLTYRSNGSPKKLKGLIEKYIHNIEFESIKENDNTLQKGIGLRPNSLILFVKFEEKQFLKKNEKDKKIFKEYSLTNSSKDKSKLFLRLNYKDQYKTGLHTSIFLPYLTRNEFYLKDFNDKNLYLSAFLLDHILKFHKSAFSWRELEIMPDIIIGSKGPSLRDMMNGIVDYLSVRHIRETTNAIFQYKFRSRTSLELAYLSKISDESAAAFNFTYDESLHLKMYFKQKLKQKIEAYKNDKSIVEGEFIHTISYLNSLIADIHFYDEEYSAAIRYYSDAIQPLRAAKKIKNNHQKMLFSRNRMLLSLCLEKSKRYDSAYSIIRNTILDFGELGFRKTKKYGWSNTWEDPYKRMQLFLRPHLSLLMIIEKDRSDGITFSNLQRNIKEYSNFMSLINLWPYKSFILNRNFRKFIRNNKDGDHKRIHTLLADYYQTVGSILFFKNRAYLKLYKSGVQSILFNCLEIKALHSEKLSKEEIENNNYEKTGFSKENNTIKPLYFKLSNIVIFFEIDHSHYLPSFSSFFYYSTSLGHLLMPYIENLKGLFKLPSSNYESLTNKMFVLENLAYTKKASHILGGKQKELIALILSKWSDSILACIGSNSKTGLIMRNKNPDFEVLLSDNDMLYDRIGFPKNMHCQIESFEELFDVSTVFYFNMLSYRFYFLAGKITDALFSLKKSIYLVTTHPSIYESSKLKGNEERLREFIKGLMNWHLKKCAHLIETYSISVKNTEESFYSNVTYPKIPCSSTAKETIPQFNSSYFLNNEEEIEIDILSDRLNLIYLKSDWKLKIADDEKYEKKLKELNGKYIRNQVIQTIFTRIQQLKFNTEIIYTLGKEKIDLLENIRTINSLDVDRNDIIIEDITFDKKEFLDTAEQIIFLFKYLTKTIHTYGISYSMTNAYLAGVYKHLFKWSNIFTALETYVHKIEQAQRLVYLSGEYGDWYGRFFELVKTKSVIYNPVINKNKAIEFYEKAISLHSEGPEYERIIKDLYVLEDDFNDNHIHFYAALERSLINTGQVSKQLKELKDK